MAGVPDEYTVLGGDVMTDDDDGDSASDSPTEGMAANAVVVIPSNGKASKALTIRQETHRDFFFMNVQPFVIPKGLIYSRPLLSVNSLLN